MRSSASRLVVVLLLALLFGPAVLAWRGLLDPAVAAVVVAVLAIPVLWLARGRSAGRKSAEEGTVWDLIPSRQYGGRHVESGGLSRDEQERALRDVAERADEMEGHRD